MNYDILLRQCEMHLIIMKGAFMRGEQYGIFR